MIEEALKNIIKEYPTPLFLFDADELRSRAFKIKEILNANGNKTGLCYSIKANPFLIPQLTDVVDKFEVCSPGELSICMSYNVKSEMIIYSGVHKEEEDITEAVKFGVGILTAESVRHYGLIDKVAKKLEKKVNIILRLSSKSQFGMSIDDIRQILKENAGNKYVNIEGLHYFAGTQRVKLKHQREELMMLKDVFSGLREEFGMELRLFEYGPGLAFPYFTDEDRSDTLKPLKELADDLYTAAGFSSLTVEMGRFLASSCGYYLTGVCDVKRSHDNIWCILDGGINHLNYLGQMMGMKTPVIITLPNKDSTELNNTFGLAENQTLCGSLCTTNDVILRSFKDRRLESGDVLVFCNTGAYTITEGLNLFLSRNMPVVLIKRDGIISKVRDVTPTWKLNS
ncbi:MAG: diaminopimelate decarboxylase [Lachnospiraceae bacterium]|nr:diaminopimelate decarboxylase [Lachnospiraceae bacterium]